MTEIADFLRARIAERRALAEAATEKAGSGDWRYESGADYVSAVQTFPDEAPARREHWTPLVTEAGSYVGDTLDDEIGQHIAASDPAAVIADCDAKLAIVDMHPPEEIPEHSRRSWQGFTVQCASESWKVYSDAENRVEYPCRTLRLLAQQFAGHPDHKGEEWTP